MLIMMQQANLFLQKEFYIALPMSTDIPDSQKEMINAHVYNTIVFGSDYTWTKQSGLATHGFDETKTGFTHKKVCPLMKMLEIEKLHQSVMKLNTTSDIFKIQVMFLPLR